jgi:hypothetical protein
VSAVAVPPVRRPAARGLPGRGLPGRGGIKPNPRFQYRERLNAPNILVIYLVAEIACAVMLLVPSLQAERVIFRSAAFTASLVLLAFLPQRGSQGHPSRGAAAVGMLVIALGLFNPMTNTLAAGVASVALNVAVCAPIFWVPRIRIDISTVRRLFFVFWAFQTASAAMGVLQVYFPGRFEPALAANIADDPAYLGSLHITLASGERVLRPMGLTDSPGGAGVGGTYAVLLSCAFLLDRPRLLYRIVLIGGLFVGCFALYLCQVRSLAVMLSISMIAMVIPFALRGRIDRATSLLVPLIGAAVVAFGLAVSIGGDSVTNRLGTLFEGNAQQVYYSNRGFFLKYTFVDLVPEYPFGAGLGRWGMMLSYFGDRHNTASPPIWAEIQWTGWLLDGGLPLMGAYFAALFIAIREAFRIATRVTDDPQLANMAQWASILLGYSVGVFAVTFNSCPFAGTMGIDFWLLNATVIAAARQLEAEKTRQLQETAWQLEEEKRKALEKPAS